MTRDRNFYRQFFRICIVLVLQNVITLSVNLADNIMLGNYQEVALSGATAVNQIQFIYQQLLIGIGDGLVIFGSQHWGNNKNVAEIKKIASIAMRFALIVMILFFLISSFIPDALMRIFTTDPTIIENGISYMKIIRYTYIFFCLTTILLSVLRSVETVKIAFYLSVSSLLINCSINWVLIYGRYGFPELGIAGAAIGTLAARIIEFLFLLFYLVLKDRKLHLKFKDFLSFNRELCRDFVKICSPIFLGAALWGINTAMQTAILGHMSSSAIAANSVASNLFLLIKTAAIGACSSASILIGTTIGAKKMDKLKEYVKTLQILFVIIGVISSILLLALINPVLSLYRLSAESQQLAHTFLLILCATTVVMAYQMPTNAGIIRGGGDTKYMMILDLISIYGIVLPLSFFMAFAVKASPAVVVLCLNIDQFFKCIPAFIKVNYGHWIHELT